ncbi:hypothetical protein DRW03_19365 [Corallococcus sp. H22C18031201]|nr:hypothetical protein DRW03_19365 [Corallococcus sp. H22C18031201]
MSARNRAGPVERGLCAAGGVTSLALLPYFLRHGWRPPPFEFWAALVGGLGALSRLFSGGTQWRLDRATDTVERWSLAFGRSTVERYALSQFTHVELRERGPIADAGLVSSVLYRVVLKGPEHTLILAGSHDEDETRALAEAVTRVLGGGLSIKGGPVRGVDERLSAAPLRHLPPEPPPGSHIRASRAPQGLGLWLPATGWRPRRLVQAAIAGLIGLVSPPAFLGLWASRVGMAQETAWIPATTVGFLVLAGGYLFWRVAREATSGWHIAASSRGLEVVRLGRWARREPVRIPATRIHDIDLRQSSDGARGERELGVIVDHDGGELALGMGLPRASLEWTEGMLRRALATPPEAHRHEAAQIPTPAARQRV